MIEGDRSATRVQVMVNRCSWLVIAASLGLIVVAILSRFAARYVWDDAYMYVRYADNVITHGVISWNPGGEPTYGLTSLLFLAVVLPIRLLVPNSPAMTAILSSLVCGIIFLGLLVALLYRYTDESRMITRIALLLVTLSLALASEHLAPHFVSGMDTTFALVFVTTYIIICKWQEQSLSAVSTIVMGVWGALAFSARPDLVLYSLLVPASIVALETDPKAKRNALVILGITVAGIGLQMWVASRYFHSPLPLPFYAKGTRLYEDFNYSRYRFVPVKQLFAYSGSYGYLFLLIGADLLVNLKEWRRDRSAAEIGLVIATCLFVLYYLFFVLQIMYFSQRFYYPTLPAIAFLAARSTARLIRKIPQTTKQTSQELIRELPRFYLLLATFLLLAQLLPVAMSVSGRWLSEVSTGSFANLNVNDDYKANWTQVWFRLGRFSSLPDSLVIAATEVGHIAALNPDKTIIDLTGLNETSFARNGFSADLLFEQYQPDLIYMPHPDYQRMIAEITNHPYFIQHYDYFPARTLGGVRYRVGRFTEILPNLLGIALRRDSPYYPAMREVVDRDASE